MYVSWEDYVADPAIACRGCGLPMDNRRGNRPPLLPMDADERAAYDAEDAAWRDSREGPWWKLRQTIQVPRYEYRVEVFHVTGVTIRDESYTYEHRIVRIAYDAARDVLVFEAVPTLTIEVSGASGGDVKTTPRGAPVDVFTMKAIGPIEYY
jgi:hypothetical protein